MTNERQLYLWEQALAGCDGRQRWPRFLRKAIRIIESHKRVLGAGQGCSNICYNLSRDENINPAHRRSMQLAVAEWDAARRELR